MIIIVTGLPGSGKSYFASRMATRLSAEYINSDKVRKEMDAMGRYSLRDKIAVYTEMIRMAGRFLDESKDVVVDATFHRQSMRSIFVKESKMRAVGIYFIYVWAKEGLIRERLRIRREDSEADFNVYLKIRNEFEKLTMRHLELESTNDNITAMVSKGVDYIRST